MNYLTIAAFSLCIFLFGALILISYRWGKAGQKAKDVKDNAQTLKKQRDNDITTVDDADQVWNDWGK